MRKWLIVGAAFLLMAGTGTRVLASGANLFQNRVISPVAWQHHTEHTLGHRGICSWSDAGNLGGAGSFTGVNGAHHAEDTVACYPGNGCEIDVYGTGSVSCQVEDGYCGGRVGANGTGSVNCYVEDGYCGDWAGANGGGSVSCHVEDGYCRDWVDVDGDALCDLCGNPVCHEAAAPSGEGVLPGNGNGQSQADSAQQTSVNEMDNNALPGNQNNGSYETSGSGSGYGCGSRSTGHHGSSHHGSGHHGSGHHR